MEAEERKEEQITAVLSLLNMGIKSVPEGVLRAGFDEVCVKLLKLLNEYSQQSGNNVIVKAIIGILTTFLRAQDAAVWSNSSTTQIFIALLNPFALHTKPKVNRICC